MRWAPVLEDADGRFSTEENWEDDGGLQSTSMRYENGNPVRHLEDDERLSQ